MLKQYEELAVLEQGDDGAIVSIRGQGGPSVLLGVAYLAHLDQVLQRAQGDLDARPTAAPRSGLQLLCAEILLILTTYEETRNKYEGGGSPSGARAFTEAMAELKELRRQMDDLRS